MSESRTQTLLAGLKGVRLVPVIKLDSADQAVPLCETLARAGLTIAEITFRTAAAEESIARVAKELPGVLPGAGTVLNVEQVKRAVGAGARFIVSPGLCPAVVEYCVKNDIPVLPGICTPTELMAALEFGLETVKFFPAEQAGGLAMIKALAAPFGNVTFMPTGGIGPGNLRDYLGFEKIVACGGSWMVKDDLVRAGSFDKIYTLAREAAELAAR